MPAITRCNLYVVVDPQKLLRERSMSGGKRGVPTDERRRQQRLHHGFQVPLCIRLWGGGVRAAGGLVRGHHLGGDDDDTLEYVSSQKNPLRVMK